MLVALNFSLIFFFYVLRWHQMLDIKMQEDLKAFTFFSLSLSLLVLNFFCHSQFFVLLELFHNKKNILTINLRALFILCFFFPFFLLVVISVIWQWPGSKDATLKGSDHSLKHCIIDCIKKWFKTHYYTLVSYDLLH